MDDFPKIMARPQDHGGVRITESGYSLSDEVEAVARRLIAKHPRFRPLQDFTIAYLLKHGDLPRSKDRHLWAKARGITDLYQALCPYQGAVYVMKVVWEQLPEQAREALLAHELCHFEVNEEKGTLGTMGHDIEEFGFVVGEYGQWRPDLTWFAEQMQLGLAKVGAAGNASLD